MKRKTGLTMCIILAVMLCTQSVVTAAEPNFPIKINSAKWSVELEKGKASSSKKENYKSFQLTMTYLGQDKINGTVEFFRPTNGDEMINILDKINYKLAPNGTIELGDFFVDKNANKMEIVISWHGENNRIHKQSFTIRDFQY